MVHPAARHPRQRRRGHQRGRVGWQRQRRRRRWRQRAAAAALAAAHTRRGSAHAHRLVCDPFREQQREEPVHVPARPNPPQTQGNGSWMVSYRQPRQPRPAPRPRRWPLRACQLPRGDLCPPQRGGPGCGSHAAPGVSRCEHCVAWSEQPAVQWRNAAVAGSCAHLDHGRGGRSRGWLWGGRRDGRGNIESRLQGAHTPSMKETTGTR